MRCVLGQLLVLQTLLLVTASLLMLLLELRSCRSNTSSTSSTYCSTACVAQRTLNVVHQKKLQMEKEHHIGANHAIEMVLQELCAIARVMKTDAFDKRRTFNTHPTGDGRTT